MKASEYCFIYKFGEEESLWKAVQSPDDYHYYFSPAYLIPDVKHPEEDDCVLSIESGNDYHIETIVIDKFRKYIPKLQKGDDLNYEYGFGFYFAFPTKKGYSCRCFFLWIYWKNESNKI